MARTKKQIVQHYQTQAPARREGESLEQYGRRLAMNANKKMQRLRKYSEREHMHGILDYAYKNAMHDIQSDTLSWGNPKNTTYTIKMPQNQQALQSKINSMIKFIESPTSTLTGIKAIYKERTKTINERYGTNFTWQDLANYYEKDVSNINDGKYGSKTLIKALGTINRMKQKKNESDSDYKERMKQVADSNKKLSGDYIVDQITRELLKDGLTAEKLFG